MSGLGLYSGFKGASGSNGIAEIFTSGGMGTSGFIPSRYFAAAHNAQQTAHIAAQTLPSPPPLAVRPRTPPPKSISSKLKDIENESDTSRRSPRKRSATSPAAPSPTSVKKGKMKANDSDIVRTMLEGFEDEMTCPICCDIFVAAHLGNPCGHTFCGACGYSWISQNKSTPTCATCRAKLSTSSPLIPNFAVDNTVERHIRAMVANGDNEWRDGGKKMKDWSERKETWKKESAARVAAKPKPTRPQSRHRDRVVWVDDEDEQWLVPDGDSEDDGDYQPPPAPVVPAAVGPPPAALHQVVEAYGYLPVADASGSRGRRRNRRRRGGNRGRGG
ncbi:hypothetical protein PLICRDRAFT_35592 [Plicaturopsis crispa FD-325 SS-3]|nr:hypothetical protein PLICRDRAFT_35592 [Plicaturopsis crispa FD-325 SS-3]